MSVDAGLAALSEGSYHSLVPLSRIQIAEIVLGSSAILVGSLNIAFRFVFRLNVVRRAILIAVTVLLLVTSDYMRGGWLWSSVWLLCACSGVHWTKRLNPNALILNAIVLYGLGITSTLDLLGLSSAYNHPFISLTAISIAWIALLWSGIVEVNKTSATTEQAPPSERAGP